MSKQQYKLQKRNLLPLIAIAVLAVAYAYSDRINNQLSCWMYYDQCTAKRIGGLSMSECFARPDTVAYLTIENSCLVRPK